MFEVTLQTLHFIEIEKPKRLFRLFAFFLASDKF